MRRALLVLLLAVGACGGAEQTLGEYCVERFETLYSSHGLPFENSPAERVAECERFIAEEGITTEAEVDIYAGIAERLILELGS